MSSVICTEENLPQLKEQIISSFKEYCDTCVSNNIAIVYSNRLPSSPNEGSPRTEKNEALFQWANKPNYVTNSPKVADDFLKTVLYPCLEYALNIREVYQWSYRANFKSNGAEHVRIIPNRFAPSNPTKHKKSDASETNFFSDKSRL